MSFEEAAAKAAAQAAVGAAAGVATGAVNAAAPHVMRGGMANPAAKFFNEATKSFKAHHKVGQALAAGGGAVAIAVGHGVAATAVAAAASIALPLVAAGGVAIGAYKLTQHLRRKKA